MPAQHPRLAHQGTEPKEPPPHLVTLVVAIVGTWIFLGLALWGLFWLLWR